jgi:hypothetical protein
VVTGTDPQGVGADVAVILTKPCAPEALISAIERELRPAA